MQIMNCIKPYPMGKKIAIFTNNPEPIGENVYFTDSDGNLKNVARIYHVGLSSDTNVNNGRKYVMQMQVVEVVSAHRALGSQVYLS
jgi:hypothetical protein